MAHPPNGAPPLSDFSEYAVPIDDVDLAHFVPHTDESVYLMAKRLHEIKGTMTATELELRSQIYGFNWNPIRPDPQRYVERKGYIHLNA